MRHGYWASAAYMDVQLGRVYEELERSRMTMETVVVFFSDHGYSLGERSFWGKQTLRDEALRVPLVFSMPWMESLANKRSFDMIELIDLFPTIISLANLPRTEDRCLLGKDFSTVLESDVPGTLIW
jgi:iduronate 2-sulfatase